VLGAIDNTVTFEGVIIRNEQVFTARAGGVPVWEVSDGTRVRVGDLVCGIHDAEVVAQLNAQIAAINRQTLNIQDFRAELSVVEEDVARMNGVMTHIINEQSFNINLNNPQAMYGLRNMLEGVLDERNELLLNENRGALRGNVATRNMYGERLQQAKDNMYTTVSGVASFMLDGMEDVLTVNRLRNLTVERTRQKIPGAVPVTGSVSEGTPVFKIITSNTWHIVSHMDKTETVGWTENMRKNIYVLRNGTFVRLETRVSVLEDTGDFSYVVFTTSNRIIDFLDVRSVVFKLDNNITEGLRIPNTAIAEHTLLVIPNACIVHSSGLNRVTMINPNGRDTLIDVIVASSDEVYSYAVLDHNRLRLGNILMNHETGGIYEISEVRIRRGVYINSIGSADFRDINMDGSVRNENFTILCRELNGNIRIGDSIIVDARNIVNRQLIY
jgi:hypothetical protein